MVLCILCDMYIYYYSLTIATAVVIYITDV